MRYHWGLGVGHTYAHHWQEEADVTDAASEEAEMASDENAPLQERAIVIRGRGSPPLSDDGQTDSSSPEDDASEEGSYDSSESQSDSQALVMDDMYGSE